MVSRMKRTEIPNKPIELIFMGVREGLSDKVIIKFANQFFAAEVQAYESEMAAANGLIDLVIRMLNDLRPGKDGK